VKKYVLFKRRLRMEWQNFSAIRSLKCYHRRVASLNQYFFPQISYQIGNRKSVKVWNCNIKWSKSGNPGATSWNLGNVHKISPLYNNELTNLKSNKSPTATYSYHLRIFESLPKFLFTDQEWLIHQKKILYGQDYPGSIIENKKDRWKFE
jgi:hypothetical protein